MLPPGGLKAAEPLRYRQMSRSATATKGQPITGPVCVVTDDAHLCTCLKRFNRFTDYFLYTVSSKTLEGEQRLILRVCIYLYIYILYTFTGSVTYLQTSVHIHFL